MTQSGNPIFQPEPPITANDRVANPETHAETGKDRRTEAAKLAEKKRLSSRGKPGSLVVPRVTPRHRLQLLHRADDVRQVSPAPLTFEMRRASQT